MRLIIVFCLVTSTLSFPSKTAKKLGNPDEWGKYFQGDIILPLPPTKNGILDESRRWPNGQVAYSYSSAFQEEKKKTVQKAMDSYSTLTGGCITFVERTTETDYVEFYGMEEDGCYSSVGKVGGAQAINYPQWCIDVFGSVQHEMYHALGFFHEQSRPDRDDYVKIEWENIEEGEEFNFMKYPDSYVGTFGEDYDYGSVMHYSGYAFSDNGELTIVTTDPTQQDTIGQREGLSQIDINKLMKMYNC